MKLSEKQGGVLLMLLSALFFSAMQAAVSYSGSRIPVMEQVFCRNLISLVVAFVLIRKNKLSPGGRLWPGELRGGRDGCLPFGKMVRS